MIAYLPRFQYNFWDFANSQIQRNIDLHTQLTPMARKIAEEVAIHGLSFFAPESGLYLQLPDFASPRTIYRIRTFCHLFQFGHQFTLTLTPPPGSLYSEVDRVLGGEIDYLIYAFADPSESYIVKVYIISCSEFRRQWQMNNSHIQWETKNTFNYFMRDGYTYANQVDFMCVNVDSVSWKNQYHFTWAETAEVHYCGDTMELFSSTWHNVPALKVC